MKSKLKPVQTKKTIHVVKMTMIKCFLSVCFLCADTKIDNNGNKFKCDEDEDEVFLTANTNTTTISLNENNIKSNQYNSLLNDGDDELLLAPHLEMYDGNDHLFLECMDPDEPKLKPKPTLPRKAIATREEINHKRNIAIIRTADRRNKNEMKNKLEDLFWPISDWPPYIVGLLLSPTFNYIERLSLATFFHGNGLRDASLAVTLIQFYNENWRIANHIKWKAKFYKFEKLFDYLDKAYDTADSQYHYIRKTYYFYSMMIKHMLYYNGDKRKNGNPEPFVQHHY